MYAIYHIPNVKVGCTKSKSWRFSEYKKKYGDEFEIEIIEEWPLSVGDVFAGDRERYWAGNYGYPPGPHYGSNSWNSAMTPEALSEWGRDMGRASIFSQMSRGVHASQNGKTPFFTMSKAERQAGVKTAIARGTHVTQTQPYSTLIAWASIGGKKRAETITRKHQKLAGRKSQLDALAKGTHITQRMGTCPHCGKTANVAALAHYHFGRCKQKGN